MGAPRSGAAPGLRSFPGMLGREERRKEGGGKGRREDTGRAATTAQPSAKRFACPLPEPCKQLSELGIIPTLKQGEQRPGEVL